jgi:hypothetical protein
MAAGFSEKKSYEPDGRNRRGGRRESIGILLVASLDLEVLGETKEHLEELVETAKMEQKSRPKTDGH